MQFSRLRFAIAILALGVTATAVQAASIEAMAGQMIIVGFHGDSASDKSVQAVAHDITDGSIGGIMYLQTNVASLSAVKAMNAAFNAASPSLPPFITLDQEGGAVERLTHAVGFAEVPSAQTVAANDKPADAEKLYSKMANAIADLGFTVNFGPIVDLNINPKNPIIGKFGRSFSKDPATVDAYAEAFIQAHHDAGLLTALKHFPGHGSSTADSHQGFVDISKTWSPVELEPYKALFASGYSDFVMVGHLYHKDYTEEGAQLPASLSPEWITGVLRNQLGFKGVVISDDLEMGAIRKRFDLKETVVRAVNAGADVLLFSNTAKYDPDLGSKIQAILVAEANADPAFAAKITQSYDRIVAMKGRIGG
ncbi:MAG TPA: glycoside hydrolase family 3 N-terminal domain-containing protein [Devosiaceae bacterium]